jgi:UDP-GlcNAc3NAcA epimerase
MFDAVKFYESKIETNSSVIKKESIEKQFILATFHRAENTNDPVRLRAICDAINEINSTIRIVLPLHPRTKSFLESQQIKLRAHIIDPVGYFDMLALLKNCKMVMTDSGGLQKEAYFFQKFCVTLRDQTEWIELVESGANALAGASKDSIITQVEKNLNQTINTQEGLYGDGHAAHKIVSELSQFQ